MPGPAPQMTAFRDSVNLPDIGVCIYQVALAALSSSPHLAIQAWFCTEITCSHSLTSSGPDNTRPSTAVPRSRRRRSSLAVRLYSIHKNS
jgi:hypothetical protein